MNDITRFDLSIRRPPDVERLFDTLLNRIDYTNAGLGPVRVISEITPATDAMLLSGTIILYQCGPFTQPDWNLKAWIWQGTLSLTVLGEDPDLVYETGSVLDTQVAEWPWDSTTPYGRVGRVVSNPMFQRVNTGDMATSKSVTARSSTKLIQTSLPPVRRGNANQ